MKIVVLKFGGTSVGTIDRIKKVADLITNYVKKKYNVIVVSSAMTGATNDLINKSNNISNNFSNAEYDVLVSSGEQVACALIAGRLIHKGYKSRSWMGWQIPIFTNENHTSSQIMKIKTDEILNFISKKGVAVIAGFQGISKEIRITTLGRGGSDLSAVAIAKFFQTGSSGRGLFFETGSSGVTVLVKNNNWNLAGQYSGATLKKVAESTWHLVGDLT